MKLYFRMYTDGSYSQMCESPIDFGGWGQPAYQDFEIDTDERTIKVAKPKHGWHQTSGNSEDYWVNGKHCGFIVHDLKRTFVYPNGSAGDISCTSPADARKIVEKFA